MPSELWWRAFVGAMLLRTYAAPEVPVTCPNRLRIGRVELCLQFLPLNLLLARAPLVLQRLVE